ncbi:Mss4 protein [Ancylostoma duodenale]|uniref:Mss4 protein n=1 Tax=Ancylostoma duodenale TaxID=51022 RepID=A0A0C2D0L8_9BILA|nr:Mss4 protein [Ancylostoma duodenale]
MAKATLDLSKAFPEKLVIKECHGRNEEINRDDLLNVDDKNWNTIVCRRCDSVIFPEDRVKYIEDYTVELPEMIPGGKGSTGSEKISWWWYTKNDKDFDTIGYAWVVIDGKKTLLCGDCEFGPIGLRTPDDKEYWVAVERVRYVDKQPRHPKAPPKKAKKTKQ